MTKSFRKRQIKTWRVLVATIEGDTSTSAYQDVTAVAAVIEHGALQFFDRDGDVEEGFGPGVWLHVKRVGRDPMLEQAFADDLEEAFGDPEVSMTQ